MEKFFCIEGICNCDFPNSDLFKFIGSLHIKINDNTLNRANIIWPSYSIIHSALTELLTNMNKYIKVSTTRDYIKNTKYIHYMILYNNIIYYIVYTEHKSIFFIYPYY